MHRVMPITCTRSISGTGAMSTRMPRGNVVAVTFVGTKHPSADRTGIPERQAVVRFDREALVMDVCARHSTHLDASTARLTNANPDESPRP